MNIYTAWNMDSWKYRWKGKKYVWNYEWPTEVIAKERVLIWSMTPCRDVLNTWKSSNCRHMSYGGSTKLTSFNVSQGSEPKKYPSVKKRSFFVCIQILSLHFFCPCHVSLFMFVCLRCVFSCAWVFALSLQISCCLGCQKRNLISHAYWIQINLWKLTPKLRFYWILSSSVTSSPSKHLFHGHFLTMDIWVGGNSNGIEASESFELSAS